MLTDPERIKNWLHNRGIYLYKLTANNEVDILGGGLDLSYSHKKMLKALRGYFPKLSELPVQFNEINGDFNISNNQLRSMKGFPRIVKGKFDASSNLIETFDHSPTEVIGEYNVKYNKIKSLVGIADHVKCIKNGIIKLSNNPITEGGVGLFLIEGLTDIQWGGTGNPKRAVNVIRKYIGDNYNGIFDCQTELIDKGLEQFAQL